MSQLATDQKVGVFRFTTLRIVTAAVLVALVILMGVVPFIGFIPVPTPAGSMTTEQIPVILGSILEGPLVGAVTGLAWGLISFTRATGPSAVVFKDPLVSVLPRIIVGITPWLIFTAIMRSPFARFKRIQLDVAAGSAGFVGAVTNTLLVVGMAVLRGYWPAIYFLYLLPQAAVEAVVSTIITILVARIIFVIRNGIVRATDTKKREDMAY